MLRINYVRQPEKFLDNAPQVLRRRILDKIELLRADPVPHDAVRVQGDAGPTFRIRVGDYRVLYQIITAEQRIKIVKIDKRAHAYDR